MLQGGRVSGAVFITALSLLFLDQLSRHAKFLDLIKSCRMFERPKSARKSFRSRNISSRSILPLIAEEPASLSSKTLPVYVVL
jgi:hypothetical protein